MSGIIIGSRWWKVDFHTHTPASDDYGKGEKQCEYKKITPEEWCLNFMKAEIDCVAVTDHNSGEWIDKVKEAVQKLEKQKNPNYRKLFIIPGVEVSVDSGIHLLALFKESTKSSDIVSFMGAIKYRGNPGETETCAQESTTEILKEIHERGGIVIPAHVDEEKGLFSVLSGVSLRNILELNKLSALEIKNKNFLKPSIYLEKKLSLSEVIGSDSHHPEGKKGEKYPGSHFTWIKMDIPSFEGIKLALFDGETSVRNQEIENPNKHSDMLIEELEIKNAKYFGRGTSYKKEFNPWLNSIVGGRGTGKSSSLEFLRILLEREDEIPEKLRADYSKYKSIYKNRADDGLLTDNTELSLIYLKDLTRYKIIWDARTKKSEIQTQDEMGNWIVSQGDVKQRFPVRIYSQKQIFEMANHPEALIKIIDDSIVG